MSVSDQDMLDEIDAAILAILQGKAQSTSKPGGFNYTRLSLSDLQKMKAEYEVRVARGTNGSFFVAQARNPE